MAELHKIQFSDADYKKAAEVWQKQLLLMPIIACSDTLKYMTGLPGIRTATHLGSVQSQAQFAPYKASRKSANTTEIIFRTIEPYFGNVSEDFEPNQYIQTLLGLSADFLGDGQKQAPSAKLVLGSVAKALGGSLNDALFTAKRNADGDTTADLFNGWLTIAEDEIEKGNISQAKGNLFTLGETIDASNAVDLLKEVERSCHTILRNTEKFLFCAPEVADAYNDNYLLTHSGINYNTKFEQPYLEGSNHKTTIVPLSNLSGSKKMILTPKMNMVYGYDNMSDVEKISVDRFSPWILTFSAAMFFGTQFRTIDQRFLKIVELKSE